MEGAAPKIPPNIAVNLSEDLGREASASSPLDTSLLNRKIERQQHKAIPRPSNLSDMTPPDSPGLQVRIDQLEDGADPTTNSSPFGTALLAKKAARGEKSHQSSSLGPGLTDRAVEDEPHDGPVRPPPPER